MEYLGSSGRRTLAAAPPLAWHVALITQDDAGDCGGYWNGVEAFRIAAVSTSASTLRNWLASNLDANYWSGNGGDVCCLAGREASAEERDNLNAYLIAKYGVTP